jgi:hypothetical protein
MPPKNIYENDATFSPPPMAQIPVAQTTASTPVTSTVQPPKKRSPKILIFLGIGVILTALIFLALKLMTGSKNTSSGQVTWWGLWEESSIITPLIASYESTHPGVKITYVKQSQQDYRERLTNALAKGTGPDIFSFHNSWVPMFRGDLDSLPAGVMNCRNTARIRCSYALL